MSETPSFSLLKLDGKPLEKLIEVISNGIGVLYRPTAIKKEAAAKSYEIKVVEKAKAEALAESKMIEYESLDKIERKILNKEAKRLNNIESVVTVAAERLNEEGQVSEEPVNTDWSSRFFEYAQEVSDNEMQEIWANLLAKEIKSPGEFSFRAMQTLSTMTKAEALKFTDIVNNSVTINGLKIHHANHDILTPTDTWLFEDIGILTYKTGRESFSGTSGQIKCGNLDISIHFQGKFDKRRFYFSIEREYVFTAIGLELAKLTSHKRDKRDLENIKKIVLSLIGTGSSPRMRYKGLDIKISGQETSENSYEILVILPKEIDN